MTGGFASASCAWDFGRIGFGTDTEGVAGAGVGVDSDLGATVSSAHTGAVAQDNPIIITMTVVIVDRMSIHQPLLDFNDPAMRLLNRLTHLFQGTEKRQANLGHPPSPKNIDGHVTGGAHLPTVKTTSFKNAARGSSSENTLSFHQIDNRGSIRLVLLYWRQCGERAPSAL